MENELHQRNHEYSEDPLQINDALREYRKKAQRRRSSYKFHSLQVNTNNSHIKLFTILAILLGLAILLAIVAGLWRHGKL